MVTKCPNCDNSDFEPIKCLKCGSLEFLERELALIQEEPQTDESSYEYICYNCGSKLELPEP